MDEEDFLAAVEADNKGVPVTDEPTPEPEAAKEEASTPQEPTEPTPQGEAEPETLELTTDEIVPPKPDAADGRLLALLEERDKRKAAEQELERLRAQQPRQMPERPDEYEDPEGARAYDQAILNNQLYVMRLQFSERVARVEHGAEKVEAAKTWAAQKADQDPLFNAKALQSDDPIGFAIAEYQREQIASKVTPEDFDKFLAWQTAQQQLQQKQPGQVPTQPKPASSIPTPSLASAPSAGSILTEPIQSEEEIFDEVIGKR